MHYGVRAHHGHLLSHFSEASSTETPRATLIGSSWGSCLHGSRLRSAHCIITKKHKHTHAHLQTHTSRVAGCPSVADKAFCLTSNAAGAMRGESRYTNCEKWRLRDKCCHHQTGRGRQRPDYKSGTAASLNHRVAGLNVPGMWPLPRRQSVVDLGSQHWITQDPQLCMMSILYAVFSRNCSTAALWSKLWCHHCPYTDSYVLYRCNWIQ